MLQKLSLSLLLAFMLMAGVSNAQTKFTTKSYQIIVAGTSTMHDWTSKATAVTVTGDFSINNGTLEKINAGTVKIDAVSLKSTKNSDLMDDRTHITIKADKYPSISYVFVKIVSTQKSGAETTVTVNGNLTIAGVTKPTDLVLKFKPLANGDVEITGSRKIRMSNHGIKPPSFMLGAMKVADEITISYDVILKKV
jgi:polyisoprenoid-binding protein YceI